MRRCARIWMSGSGVCCWGWRPKAGAGRDQGDRRGDRGASRHRRAGGAGARRDRGTVGAGAHTRWWPQEAHRVRPGAAGRAESVGGSGDSRGSDVAVGVDDQVDAQPRRRADRGGASGLGPDGGADAARRWGSACKPTPRSSRAASTRTATPSSATSTGASASTSPPVSR